MPQQIASPAPTSQKTYKVKSEAKPTYSNSAMGGSHGGSVGTYKQTSGGGQPVLHEGLNPFKVKTERKPIMTEETSTVSEQ